MKSVFRMPKPVKIVDRTSGITNAFINGIIPVIEPSDEEINDALRTLGMTRETICCAYCGDSYTEWDHFHPLIKNKRHTGYISEIHNLVPACGKCNQSKGNRDWEEWINSDAQLSPKTRGINDLEQRIERLHLYEKKYKPWVINVEEIVGFELWEQHKSNYKKLIALMKECQETSDIIKQMIYKATKGE